MKLVCVSCQVEFVIEKSGAVCCDMFNNPPQPYKLWHCDAWRCPSCGTVVLAGFADMGYTEHCESGFKQLYDDARQRFKQWFVMNFEHVGDNKYKEEKHETSMV